MVCFVACGQVGNVSCRFESEVDEMAPFAIAGCVSAVIHKVPASGCWYTWLPGCPGSNGIFLSLNLTVAALLF